MTQVKHVQTSYLNNYKNTFFIVNHQLEIIQILTCNIDGFGKAMTQNIAALFGVAESEIIQSKFHLVEETKCSIKFEVNAPFFDIEWVEMIINPAEEGFTVFIQDISDLKHIDEAIDESQNQFTLMADVANEIILHNEPRNLLNSLFTKLSAFLNLDVYFNYLLDEEAGRIRLMNYSGVSEEMAKSIEWLDLGEAVCGTVAKERKAFIEVDIAKSNAKRVEFVKSLGVNLYVCHPLMAYGRLIGTLSFGSKTRTQFSQRELDLIKRICEQYAKSLERLLLISQLKQQNQHLENVNGSLLKAKEKAEIASKAKLNFLKMMSHELRTPLNSILGFSQILLENSHEPLSKKQKVKVERIISSSSHLLLQINDILDIVRGGNGKLSLTSGHVNLKAVVEHCLDTMKHEAQERNITLLHAPDKGDVMVSGDEVRLKQVIMNLLSNAIHYNKNNGEVMVKYNETSSDTTLHIIDTGIGMEKTELEKVFQPFYQVDKDHSFHEGSGIGLTIVRKLITEMGGTYHIESIPYEGTSFSFTLKSTM